MPETIKFSDIPDMERYLADDCYCPGEIYDISGFFYQVYTPEDECKIIAQNDLRTAIVANLEDKHPQAIIIWHDDDSKPGKIIDTQRVDATENNINMLKHFVETGSTGDFKIDEFVEGQTAKDLNKILSISDAIIID